MSVIEAVNDIRREAASVAADIRSAISALDFSLDATLAIRDKYNAITLDVLGRGYEAVVDDRKMPPVNPNLLFDQMRIGIVDITAMGDVFLPSAPSISNLSSLREFYLAVGEDLDRVSANLAANPPKPAGENSFTTALNQFAVTAVSSIKPNGIPKTNEDYASEVGRESFEVFIFPDLPNVAFLVIPEFIAIDASVNDTARVLGLRTDQIALRVIWYGTINASTFNFNKMRTSLNLKNSQIRVASFGDDLAKSSSNLFFSLLESMEAQFSSIQSQTSVSKLLEIFDIIQEDARAFLAQLTFGTTTITSSDILNNLREAGVSDTNLESAFQNRDDNEFKGVNDTANALRRTVFPATDNLDERRALGEVFRQSTNTPRFTNQSLNVPTDFRAATVTAAKRLVASIDARKVVVQRPTVSSATVAQAVAGVVSDVAALRAAYETFLAPPTETTLLTGTRTTESANNMLSRSTDLVKSLRIKDQINNFPREASGDLDSSIEAVLVALSSIADSQKIYFDVYRSGEVRDFLAAVVSVSSMTNFLLADGDPKASLIVKEVPERIEELRASIQSNIIDATDSEELFSSVSLQVGEFATTLRGNEENDPVGRLFDLPVSVLDAILPSDDAPSAFSLDMLPKQEAAMRQLRESFRLLKNSRSATTRDLTIYRPNFGCAVTDARFLLARLVGDSVSNLVSELGQA